jgi:SAM-dependent methyltransferase
MSCPECASSRRDALWSLGDRLFRTTEERFQLWRCNACELVYLWPTPSQQALESYYPEGYWTGSATSERSLRRRLAELYRRLALRDHVRFVRRVLTEQRARGLDPRLLDIGCGDGSFLDALAFPAATAADASHAAVRAARARGLAATRARLDLPPFRPGSFTLVTMFHVLEHVSPAGSHLDAARRLLAPGGELVIQVPNSASWQARLLGGRWAGLDVPRHLVDYSDRTLNATLSRHGFEVVRESHFSLRDNATTLANSLAPWLYPPARAAGDDPGAVLRDLLYLGLTLAATPFTLLESSFRRGAAVMVQARPLPEVG